MPMLRVCLLTLIATSCGLGCAQLRTIDLREVSSAKSVFSDNHQQSRACLLVARELMEDGQHKAAVKQYERALSFQPSLEIAHELALACAAAELRPKAEQAFEKALKQQPRDAAVMNDYAYFLSQQQQWERAEELYRTAIKQDPNYDKAYINLALLLGRQGRLAEAQAAFAQVLDEASVQHNMGVLLAQQGNSAAAEQAWQQAARLDPELATPQHMLDLMQTRKSPVRLATHQE